MQQLHDLQVGVDFTPDDPKFRTPGMTGAQPFAYEPDERVASLIDQFMSKAWRGGIGERKDMTASPYTMTRDG